MSFSSKAVINFSGSVTVINYVIVNSEREKKRAKRMQLNRLAKGLALSTSPPQYNGTDFKMLHKVMVKKAQVISVKLTDNLDTRVFCRSGHPESSG